MAPKWRFSPNLIQIVPDHNRDKPCGNNRLQMLLDFSPDSSVSRSTAQPWSGNSRRGKPPFATPGMQGVEQHWNKPSPRTLSPVWQMLQSGYGFQRPCSAPSSMISVLRSANDIGWGSGTVTGENQPTPLTKRQLPRLTKLTRARVVSAIAMFRQHAAQRRKSSKRSGSTCGLDTSRSNGITASSS